MKKSMAIAVAAVGIGFCANVFANSAGPQISPSTINLLARGVSDVLMHTTFDHIPDNSACVGIGLDVTMIPEDGPSYKVDVDRNLLSCVADSSGHAVITISGFTGISGIVVGTVNFRASFDGAEEIDEAKTVANSGVNSR